MSESKQNEGLSARDAVARLREGNARYVSGGRVAEARSSREHRAELLNGQKPYAVVVGCSDSRVPPELIFDAGLGELFVIRVVGEVVGPAQLASVEYAVEACGTKLVVILGHARCGAVGATVGVMLDGVEPFSESLASVVDGIRPALESWLPARREEPRGALVEEAVRANVRASVQAHRQGSKLLDRRVREDGVEIVGAVYDLESGRVDFLD